MLSRAELEWVVASLKPQLEGAIIQRVYEQDNEHRVLQCRRPGQTLYLLVGLHQELWRAHLVTQKPVQPGAPSMTTMLLRKWMQGMVIRQLELLAHERILRISGDTVDPAWVAEHHGEEERGDEAQRPPRVEISLVVEWLGRLTNMFLLDAQDKILHQWRPDRLGRGLKPGQRYEQPKDALAEGGGDEARHRWAEAEGDPSLLIAQSYQEADEAWLKQQLTQELQRRLKRQLKRARQLVKNLERDLDKAIEAQGFRKFGELLQSAYGSYRRGLSAVEVPDYYAEGMPLLSIPLDPAQGLQENISRYFKQYKRLNDATAQIEERLLEAMSKVETLERAQAQLKAAQDVEALKALFEAWESSKLLPPLPAQPSPNANKRGGAGKESKQPYRVYLSSRGTQIMVGKGSAGNDLISTRLAKGRDIWLHARDWAGAHVLVRVERQQQVHQHDLWEAAQLAAHFSKGSADTLVDVTYTEAKNVRKPKGYPPGMVTVAGGSTLAVRPDEAQVQAILSRAQS